MFNASLKHRDKLTRPQGYKSFILNSAEHKIFPTIVGILTFVSGKNSMLCVSEPEKCLNS